MSKDILELHRMIQTATIGDGDQILNILEKIVEKLAQQEQEIQNLRRERV